jgi:mono/diheme cytochrome c family protein
MKVLRFLLILLAVVVVVALGAAAWMVAGSRPMAFASGPKVPVSAYKGANPIGAPPELAGASLVQRGEYLAKAADCMVCHTAEGGRPYAGGFAFNLPFGTLYSTNITPDRETGIGAYSDADFLKAMHSGVRRDGARLYPAMPFTSYTYLADADALAIKAYLFTLPPVRAPSRANALAFPFDQRWAMGAWSLLFNPNKRFEPDSSQSPAWNRGAYLVEALAHCGECHTPRSPAFSLDNHRKFGGALTAGWRAYNISADKGTGVGDWSDDQLFGYLSTGHALGRGGASGPMGEAVDNSFSLMTPSDVHAMVAYLRTVPATVSSDLPATLAPPAPESHKQGAQAADARGKRMFEGACASCHSWTGVSPITPLATLTGTRAVNDPSAVNVAQVVISGVARRTPRGTLAMPAFGDAYSDAEIAAVANYVTARFGSKPSSITEKGVADLRKQTAQP